MTQIGSITSTLKYSGDNFNLTQLLLDFHGKESSLEKYTQNVSVLLTTQMIDNFLQNNCKTQSVIAMSTSYSPSHEHVQIYILLCIFHTLIKYLF